MKKLVLLISILLTTSLFAGQIFYVTEGGAGNKDGTSWANAYADVQTAINSASSAGGGEVWIAKGTYKHGSEMTMKNGVAIYGGFAGTETSKEERVAGNNTILDGEGKYRVFYNSNINNSAKLDNVTIQNGYSGRGAGMYNDCASPEITNCTFSGNSASWGGGMYNWSSSSPMLTNCTFTNNSASEYGGGMLNNDYSSPVLTNCTFANNSASGSSYSGGGGMYNEGYNGTCNPILTNCTFTNNSASAYGGGMENFNSSPTLTNCILWRNTANYGNEICNISSSKPTIDTCIIKGGVGDSYGTYTNIITADPKLMLLGNYGGSVQTMPVASGSSAIGEGKVVEGLITDARGFTRSSTPTIGACEFANKLTGVSITTSEGYLKYSSSYEFTLNAISEGSNLTYQWYKDAKKIEGATSSSYKTKQDAGTSKYTVVVSDGTTTITSSEIAIETVDTPRYYVSTIGNSSNDGLSWATAKSDVQEAINLAYSKYDSTCYNGPEVWIAKGTYKHGSAMTMKNNVAIYGGFAGTETSKDQRTSGNNTILDGEGKYRVFYNSNIDNSAKLDNVTIQNGYASDGDNASASSAGYGAGMYNYYASPEITNCTFSNNSASDYGGGMYNGDSSSPVLTNCTFSGNSSKWGGGMCNRSSSSPVLTNCTFSGNSASYGGGMYNYSSYPVLTNCILWGNTASSSGNEIYNSDSYSNPTIDTCIINGGYSSYGTYANIITADPKLMPLGNYGGSVQTCPVGAGSSAIGAGKVVEGLTTDARGFARSSTPTIGAYEFIPTEITSQPEDIAVWANIEEAIFMVSSSVENATYQWQYSEDGSTWYDINGETSSILSLSNVVSSQNGYQYRCGVDSDNSDLTYSNIAVLNVKSAPPSITTQPKELGVFINTDGSLSVSATGESLTYQWYFNGEAIDGATSSTLSFDNIQFDKTGSYYCVITNPAGSVQSSTAEVVVHQTARISKGLTNVQAVKEIGYARFEIESDSYNPTIKWYIGGVEFTGEDLDEDPKVLFFNVGSTIRTTVKCVLSTADGKEVSSQATLMCIDASASNAPIKIAQQPTDTQPIAWGETASFTASATAGSTVANYQWQISTDSETWENIEGANASTCSFKMEDYNKCFVRCEINNGNGAYLYSDVAKIMHSITPSEQTPDEMWLFDGDREDVEFDFDVGEDGMKFQWQMSLDDGESWIDIENADDDLFYITMSPDLDGVKVRCNYWTATSQFTSNITTLHLATPVEITREPEVYESAKLYSTVSLSVEATGYNLQYQWQISQDGETWDDIENATSSKLNVFVTEDVAFNYYRCYVYNKDVDGNVRSEAYTDFFDHGIVFPTSEEDKFGKWTYEAGLRDDNAKPTATPHNDGITNLEKFAFGLDASRATSYDANVNFKHSTDASGNTTLQFPISVDAENVVNVKALKSTDLINWVETTATATGETSSDGKFKIYKATAPVGEAGKVFLKLKVEEK